MLRFGRGNNKEFLAEQVQLYARQTTAVGREFWALRERRAVLSLKPVCPRSRALGPACGWHPTVLKFPLGDVRPVCVCMCVCVCVCVHVCVCACVCVCQAASLWVWQLLVRFGISTRRTKDCPHLSCRLNLRPNFKWKLKSSKTEMQVIVVRGCKQCKTDPREADCRSWKSTATYQKSEQQHAFSGLVVGSLCNWYSTSWHIGFIHTYIYIYIYGCESRAHPPHIHLNTKICGHGSHTWILCEFPPTIYIQLCNFFSLASHDTWSCFSSIVS